MTATSGQAQPPDEVLVRRARAGDGAAFQALVERHAGRLFAMAVSLVGNAADAEDIVQETLAGALGGLKGFEERSSVRTWLTGILVRQAAMHRRRAGRGRAREAGPAAPPGAGPGVPSDVGTVDARIDVAAAIGSLTPEHREVVVLREMQGLSYDEMAEALGVPRGTVESRLFRARRRLQELLGDYLE